MYWIEVNCIKFSMANQGNSLSTSNLEYVPQTDEMNLFWSIFSFLTKKCFRIMTVAVTPSPHLPIWLHDAVQKSDFTTLCRKMIFFSPLKWKRVWVWKPLHRCSTKTSGQTVERVCWLKPVTLNVSAFRCCFCMVCYCSCFSCRLVLQVNQRLMIDTLSAVH
jgi:hypothetical protein